MAENSSASPTLERQRSGKLGPFLGVPPTLLAYSPHPGFTPQPADGWGWGRHLRCVQDGEKKLRCGCPVLGAAETVVLATDYLLSWGRAGPEGQVSTGQL